MNSKSILIDALGAPDKSGGMQLVAFEVLSSWNKDFPHDKVCVIGPLWLKRALEKEELHFNYFTWPNSNFLWRVVGQFLVTPAVQLVTRSSKILALNAVISPLLVPKSTTIICHDWRHENNPGEFSRMQLIYRKLWKRSGLNAAKVIAISNKTLSESQQILGRKDVLLIDLGGDHPNRWEIHRDKHRPEGVHIVTFGHHLNKRPSLVAQAFIEATESGLIGPKSRLTVFGIDKKTLEKQERLAWSKYADSIVATGFVSENEYRKTLSNSDLVILASTDEGFGLPVVEAQFFGVPCLTTSDSGLAEIHGSKVISVEPDYSSLAAGIARCLAENRYNIEPTTIRTWSEVTKEIRATVNSA